MGKKNKAADEAADLKLSKAERKALKRREAELAAELERREAKAAKKAKKKAEREAATEPADTVAPGFEKKKKGAKARTIAAADAVTAGDSSEGAKVAAKTARAAAAEAGDDETDEQIKARVLAKRQRRAELEASRDSIDPADAEAVEAFNAEAEALGAAPIVTSEAAKKRAKETAPLGGVTSTPEALEAIVDPTAEHIEKAKAAVAAARDAVAAVAEVVETEHGREFVVGDSIEGVTEIAFDDATLDAMAAAERAIDEFAKPSEAPQRFEDRVNGNGQYKVKRLEDGKEIGYTRVTTYIDTLEDKTTLTKWKMRMLLEGVAVNDHPDENGRIDEPVVATMRDLIHRRDVAIAKARKADRKGKLEIGQLATIVDGAWAEFKKAVDALAEDLLTVGGAHEKAQKGTDLHALCELYDREGIDAVGDLLTEGKITPADLADVEAYAQALKDAGIKIVDIERVVVIDELKVAGRLDRTALVKFPGMARATRCVLDIKSGRIDLGAGKIAQQLELYSRGEGYDEETGERTDLKLSRTKGVVVHLPAGTGKATVHVVDLTLGRRGNGLSGEVRAWRNEGKRAIDVKTDLAAVTS